MGYHKSEIKKGVFGEVSKIQEELDELIDAQNQDCKILAACELADMIGAIRAYAKTLNLDLNDLVSMADRTEEAFKDGSRTSSTTLPDKPTFGIFYANSNYRSKEKAYETFSTYDEAYTRIVKEYGDVYYTVRRIQ